MSRLRKVLPYLFYFAAAWVAIALLGYGLALKDSAKSFYGSAALRNPFFSNPRPALIGKVTWTNSGSARADDILFRIAGDPETYVVPKEFFPNRANLQLSEATIKEGVQLGFHVARDQKTVTVLSLHYREPAEKPVMFVEHAKAGAGAWAERNMEGRGSLAILFGLILLPGAIAAPFVVRRSGTILQWMKDRRRKKLA